MYKAFWDLIDHHHYITLVSHVNPDGDTLGSALALYPRLVQMGKKVTLFNATPHIASKYDFLPNFSKIKNSFPAKTELAIGFDCGSLDRLGIEKGDYKLVNIDHHKSNEQFGDLNIVDIAYASTTLVVYDLLKHQGALNRPEALCIYTGLVEDTGFFTFRNTASETFQKAAELIDVGIDVTEIAYNLKMRNSLAKTRLTAKFIDSITLLKDAQIAVGLVTQEDFAHTGALRSDSDHLVDIIRNLVTVEVAILLLELPDRSFKVSLRSKRYIDVSLIAQSFGGGGHLRAAGFETDITDKDKIITQIIEKVDI